MQLPEYVSTDDITGVELPALSARFQVLPPQVTISGSGTHITLHPNPDRIELFRAPPTGLRQVIFHVLNFYDFHDGKADLILRTDTSLSRLGSVLRTDTSLTRLGCIVLQADGWRVTMHALQETKSLVRTLGSEGGYAITHVGRIERARKGSFKVHQAKSLIEIIRLYLSFASGRFVSCPLAVGYDRTNVIWEQSGSHISYPWRHYPGWFSSRPAILLEELFPGFLRLSKDPQWKKALPEILYWYLRANNTSEGAGVDGGIILAQAALEKLAWVHLVEDAKVLTARQFEALGSASRKIAELLIYLNIPRDIPAKLRRLRRIAKKNKWGDGPTALTGIRNDLIHAQVKYLEGRGDPFFETWSLAQRYIELVVLRLAKYSGRYTDRISAEWVGETTKVPWA
jgi:hypothetical protein